METNELERRFEVEKAWEAGATIQSRAYYNNVWRDVKSPKWEWKLYDYRVKPKTTNSVFKVGEVVTLKEITITTCIHLRDDEFIYGLSDGSWISEEDLFKINNTNKVTKEEFEKIELLGSTVKDKLNGDIIILTSVGRVEAVKHNYLFLDRETNTWKEYGS